MSTYVAHIVEQIQHNVNFLVEQGEMSQQDADLVLSRLPTGEPVPSTAAIPVARVVPASAASTVGRRGIPPPPLARLSQAKAVWGYNENEEDPNDLSFSPGDIIEIVAEDNEDWWKGRINGREGLFPSNYVEKLATPATSTRVGVAPPPQYDQHVAPLREKTPYRAFGAAHSATDKPPPPGSGQLNSVGLQQADGQEKKKSKYGKLGNTMANSAAGGVGFGAGAAIGGGLVRAIF